MTAAILRKAEAVYQRDALRAEKSRIARNAAVMQAVRSGWTHARVAEATGMTRGRVGQIVALKLAEKHGVILGTTSGNNLSESAAPEEHPNGSTEPSRTVREDAR